MLGMYKAYFTFAAMLMVHLHVYQQYVHPVIYTLQSFVFQEEFKIGFTKSVNQVVQNVNFLYYISFPANINI